jgi:hypothetical protein
MLDIYIHPGINDDMSSKNGANEAGEKLFL